MTPAEIAESRDMSITSVKAALLSVSPRYRRDAGENPELGFDDGEVSDARSVIVNTMRYAEDEKLRYNAAIFMFNEKKGRNDVHKQLGGNKFDIFAFNTNFQQVRELANKAKAQIMDVQEVKAA